MLTRDSYIAVLEKRASEESESSKDNQELALGEVSRNLTDSRSTLHGLFDNAEKTQQAETSEIKKLFPGSEKKESGSPLLKLARAAFDAGGANLPFFKTASPSVREVMFRGFADEIEKIATIKPTTVSQMATRNSMGQAYNKVHDLTHMMGEGAAPARQTIESRLAASRAAKVKKPGILTTLFG